MSRYLRALKVLSVPLFFIMILGFVIPSISVAQTFNTITKTVSNGGYAAVYIPPGVSTVKFYAKGGDGSSGGCIATFAGVDGTGGSGGGGACAYTGAGNYIVCVGGGGGGGGDDNCSSPSGGVGGSTSGDGVGTSGREPSSSGFYPYLAYKNGAGARGGGSEGGAGGTPGCGGSGSPIGTGGSGANIFGNCSAGSGNYYSIMLGGGLGNGWAHLGGGGGGGYGGGGAGGGTVYGSFNFPLADGGGGGSSYFHPSLSAPDANGYVSIPVSVIGNTVFLLSGSSGDYSTFVLGPGFPDPGSGTITLSYLCSTNANTACSSTVVNSCGLHSYGTYLCDNSCTATTAPPDSWCPLSPPTNYGSYCYPTNSCGEYNTGIRQYDGSCSASAPPESSCTSLCSATVTSYPCTAVNSCNQTASGTYHCDTHTCDAVAPSDSLCPVVCSAAQGAPCASAANSCGMKNTGTIQCNGSCSATTPALSANYGQSCTRTASNACGQAITTTGTYACDGTCSAAAPVTPPNSACTAPPAPTLSGPYTAGQYSSAANPAYAYTPNGYQVFAKATSPYVGTAYNSSLTYYFEYSTDGVNWTRGEWAGGVTR